MKRRQFLTTSAALCLAGPLGLGRRFWPATVAQAGSARKLLATSHAPDAAYPDTVENYKRRTAKDVPSTLRLFGLTDGSKREITLPFWPHSLTQLPMRPELALGVAKWTELARVIDLLRGRVHATVRAPDTYRFFGHAAFHRNGKHAYISADSLELGKGALCVYDAESWKLDGIIELPCRYPHEIVRSAGGDIVLGGLLERPGDQPEGGIMAHRGGQHLEGGLYVVDPDARKVTKTIAAPEHLLIHVALLDGDRLVACGADGAHEVQLVTASLSTGKLADAHSSPDFPRGPLHAQALSAQALDEETAAFTVCDAHKVFVWNVRTNRLQQLALPAEPLGLAWSDGRLYVNHGEEGNVSVFERRGEAWAARKDPLSGKRIGNGKHLSLLSLG